MLSAPIGEAGGIEILAPRLDDQVAAGDPDILGAAGGIILELAIIPALAVAGGVVAPFGGIERGAVELVGPDQVRAGGARHRLVDPVIGCDGWRRLREGEEKREETSIGHAPSPTSFQRRLESCFTWVDPGVRQGDSSFRWNDEPASDVDRLAGQGHRRFLRGVRQGDSSFRWNDE
jgi:hypothetical protein